MKAYIVEEAKLAGNVEYLRKTADGTPIWGVIKGNGYGLDAAKLGCFLRARGIDRFAVTDVSEAQALRSAGLVEEPILMLRATGEAEELRTLLSLGVTCTVGSLSDAAALREVAAELGVTAEAHIKIDTGMGRYGFLPQELEDIARVYRDYPGIKPVGIYTHFYRAGDARGTREQFAAFLSVTEKLTALGLNVGMRHCCNSLAFWYYPEMRLDAVRLGSCLLGRVGYAAKAGLERVGYAEATVEALRRLPKGHNVGYGGDCTVKRDTTAAIVNIGYYHGFAVERGYDIFRPRDCLRSMGRYLKYLLQGRCLTVSVGGKSCRVLGHVGMVNLVVDVTGVPCKLGDPVVAQINPLDAKGMEIIYR